MLRIELQKQPGKFVRTVVPKHRQQIATKIGALAYDPEPNDSLQMKGKASAFWRVDSGEYRIIYQFDDNILNVVGIGNRNDDKVYRDFERKL